MALVENNARILVTGGSGFMGSCFIRYLLQKIAFLGCIVNVDKLSYAVNKQSITVEKDDPRYFFIQEDICRQYEIERICEAYDITTIVHFAAETHVDNSIENPRIFLQNNILGTFCLLEVVRKNPHIHFHHISTDEVFGDLEKEGEFVEDSPYHPNSPYAASKASGDHYVRAYSRTYQISSTISHSCNNYGPFQHREKLVAKVLDCLEKKSPIPLYAEGENTREWIYVEDHASAVWTILQKGEKSKVYNIGSGDELKNYEMVRQIIDIYCKLTKRNFDACYALITYVKDREGHDFRYFLNSSRLRKLGWAPKYSLEAGIEKMIETYLKNKNYYFSSTRNPIPGKS